MPGAGPARPSPARGVGVRPARYFEPQKGSKFCHFLSDFCKLNLQPGPARRQKFRPAQCTILFSLFGCCRFLSQGRQLSPAAAGVRACIGWCRTLVSAAAKGLIPPLCVGPFAYSSYVRLLPTFDRYSGPFPSFLFDSSIKLLLLVMTFIVYVCVY